MELWTAFVIGLAGSLHCIGMCGPIVLALPLGGENRISFIIGRVLYNVGRAVTYALMGVGAGLIGQMFVLNGYQNVLSVSLGVLILLLLFLPTKLASKLLPFTIYRQGIEKVKRYWAKLMLKSSHNSLFVIGLLNGFLPCGLVYLALAGATSTGSIINGALYMFFFGIGTIPVMFAMTVLGKYIGLGVKRFFNKLIPVAGVIFAVLIIMRGLSLGIPYISPKQVETPQGEQKMECCPTTDDVKIDNKKPDEVSTPSPGE